MTTQQPSDFKREALPHDVEGYRKEAVQQTAEEFVTQRNYPFLLYVRSELWDPILLMTSSSPMRRGTQLVNYNLSGGGRIFISPIRKRQTDPSDPAIILGRTTDNDVIVPVASISTRHASFLPPHQGQAAWTVTDLGSTNGTYHKEERIVAHTRVSVHDGEYLRLGGNLIAWFLHPQKLWQVLRNPAEFRTLTEA